MPCIRFPACRAGVWRIPDSKCPDSWDENADGYEVSGCCAAALRLATSKRTNAAGEGCTLPAGRQEKKAAGDPAARCVTAECAQPTLPVAAAAPLLEGASLLGLALICPLFKCSSFCSGQVIYPLSYGGDVKYRFEEPGTYWSACAVFTDLDPLQQISQHRVSHVCEVPLRARLLPQRPPLCLSSTQAPPC